MSLPFLTVQQPASQGNDFAPYCLCSLIEPLVDVNLDGVQWWMPDILPGGTVLGGIFDYAGDATPGALLRSATFTGAVAHQYNVASFAPLLRAIGQRFYAAIWTPDRYVYTSAGGWAPVNNGHLLLPADDQVTPRRNGRFIFMPPGLAYPTGSGGGLYYVGVTYTLAVPVVESGVWTIGTQEQRFEVGGPVDRFVIGPAEQRWQIGGQ